MEKRLYFLPFFLPFFVTLLSAQSTCTGLPNVVPPAENCPLACIYCSFDSYFGNSDGYTGDGIPPGGFCSMIQNDQWLGFVAADTTATFTITPSNCQNGNGLQAAIYPDCNSAPIACVGGCAGCGNQPLTLAPPLIVGQHYYLMIDGFSGDICDFMIGVEPPSAVQAPSISPVGAISGLDTICPGGQAKYSVAAVAGASIYAWSSDVAGLTFKPINPIMPNHLGSAVLVVFPLTFTGTANICVQASNACKPALNSSCFKVTVTPPTVKQLPDITIGPSKLPYTLPWGEVANTEGVYQTTLTAATGCDSTVRVRIITCQKTIELPAQLLCADTCVYVCGIKYCQSGNYSVACSQTATCDSVINFKVTYVGGPKVLPNARVALTCTDTTRTLSASASDAVIQWVDAQGSLLSSDKTLKVNKPGIYTARSVLPNGKVCGTKAVVVKQNIQQPGITAQGGMLSPTNPSVMLQAKSTTSGVKYYWTGPNGFSSQQQNPIVTVAGLYTVTVFDPSNGCTNSISIEVTGG